jgi:hypothetical protein
MDALYYSLMAVDRAERGGMEVIPRQWKVLQTVREKFSCRTCKRNPRLRFCNNAFRFSQSPRIFFHITCALILSIHRLHSLLKSHCGRLESFVYAYFTYRLLYVLRTPFFIGMRMPAPRGSLL